MSLLGKRVRIGKYAIPALLLLALTVGTVAAVSYVVLTWTISLTVKPYPRVHFYNEDTTTEANTMTITMSIFPDIKTIDEDAAWDIRSESAGKIYIRVSALDSAEVAEVTIIAYETDPASPLFSETWSAATTTWSSDYTTAATLTDYNLWIEVTGASGATGPSASITVDMKVESP